jgi:hypothetical protein
MYTTVLFLHSYWRWVVLLAAGAALGHAVFGWVSSSPYSARARGVRRAFVAALDLQLLLGLLLYVFLSPYTHAAFANLGQVMKNPHYRFWTVEHGPVQLLAVALAHIGNRRIERASDDRTRYKRSAIFTALALAVILAAIPWPGLDIARPLLR